MEWNFFKHTVPLRKRFAGYNLVYTLFQQMVDTGQCSFHHGPMKTVYKPFLFFLPLMIFIVSGLIGCSDTAMVSNKRDEQFYKSKTNSAKDFSQAEQKITELKLLETADEYPMRIALFDNNKFYYQVDRLGNGTGTWKYNDGGLELRAPRKYFVMEFYLSAAKPVGEDMIFRFLDRFGINTLETWVRDPELVKKNKAKIEELRKFSTSSKDI